MSIIKTALEKYFSRFPIRKGAVIGVAVSGGADSLSMVLNMAEYAKSHNFTIRAATVHHGLRPEATDEANWVHNILAQRKIEHTTLFWTGKKPQTRLEEKAREKRYELLLNWCRENETTHLFLAHHAGDQTETFLSRLARGSGVDGLSAMASRTEREGIFLCRPFLELDKSVFKTDLNRRQIMWVEDEMNQDETYERVRWRQSRPILNEMGLSEKVIIRTTRRLQRARMALDYYADRFCSALVDVLPQGYAAIQERALFSLPAEICLRVLNRTICAVRGERVTVSMESLESWILKHPLKITLSGCILLRHQGVLFIAREAVRMPSALKISPHTMTHWDRFWVLSSAPIRISAGQDEGTLPFLVRQSIPHITAATPIRVSFFEGTQKELEKKFAFDYKCKSTDIVYIAFTRGLI